jgi:hypothetical protein
VLVAIGFWAFARWFEQPVRYATRASGIDIPPDSRVVYRRSTYGEGGMQGDGYSLLVLDLPPSSIPLANKRDCANAGYRYGSLRQLELHVSSTENFINRMNEGWYRSRGNYDDWVLIVFQGNRLVIETVTR